MTVSGTLYNQSSGSVLAGYGTAIGSGGSLNGAGCDPQTDSPLTEIIESAGIFGVFDYSGPATLGGTLDVELQNGFIPAVGESFEFIQFPADDLSGAFDNITNDLFNNNTEQWVLTYDNADGNVRLTAEAASAAPTPEPSTMLLIGSGLLLMGCRIRPRLQRQLRQIFGGGRTMTDSPVGSQRRYAGKSSLIGGLVTVLLGVAFVFYYLRTSRSTVEFPTPYQTILLSNGAVYYGKLQGFGTSHPVMTDVFYIVSQTNAESKQVSNVLVKRGKELHGPDRMYLTPNQIVFVEPVGTNSKVAQLISTASQ